MSLLDGRAWISGIEARAAPSPAPSDVLDAEITSDAEQARLLFGLFEEFTAAFPDLLLLTVSRDGVFLAQDGGDPEPWIAETAAAFSRMLTSRGLTDAPAEALARHVWQDMVGTANVADCNVTNLEIDGARHAVPVAQMALTQVPASLVDRMTHWDGLRQLGVRPAGTIRWASDARTRAAFYNAHEIGHLVSFGIGLTDVGWSPTGRERLIEEMRADLFGLAVAARLGLDWENLLDDLKRQRDVSAVLQEDLLHWTAPALDAAGELLPEDPERLRRTDVATLLRSADEIARAAVPKRDALRDLHAVLLHAYFGGDRPCPGSDGLQLVKRLGRGYEEARTGHLATFAQADEDAWFERAATRDPSRAGVLAAARRVSRHRLADQDARHPA